MKTTVDYEGIRFEVSGEYIPLVKGRKYMSNGDPGYPDEGGYIENLDISLGGNSLMEVLKESAIEDIEALAMEEECY